MEHLGDHRWFADLRGAVVCAGSFLGLLLLVDEAAETFTAARGALWSCLALLLLLVLFPPRVTAGEGWLTVRGVLRTRRVRTDRLVAAYTPGRTGRRLVFLDAYGSRVELDAQVLVANPPLWHHLDTDIRVAAARGHLSEHPAALRDLSERIDRETAWTVFKISGLTDGVDEQPSTH
ncbi:hypothetical protein ACFZBP_07445 [Streptomyces sp. NPDC008086]|uniref:hypothetical protein n=1 Tax=Streptomyces sp. NPDC008086 TaxID=3364807 RepID=UPI0036EEE2B7